MLIHFMSPSDNPRYTLIIIVSIAGRREDCLGVPPHHPPEGPQLRVRYRGVRRPGQSSLHQWRSQHCHLGRAEGRPG